MAKAKAIETTTARLSKKWQHVRFMAISRRHNRFLSVETEYENDADIEDRNKALVLEAFETLFNTKDFVAAEKFWSSNYIQTALIFHLGATASSVWSRAPSHDEI